MAKNNASAITSVWLAELDRFGYTLRTVGRTEKEARTAIMKEYAETYKKWNDGADPRKDYDYYGVSYYKSASEDLCVYEMTFGEVEWA